MTNKKKKKQYDRKRYLEKKQYFNDKSKKWADAHKEFLQEYQKEWNENHKDYQKNYYLEHKKLPE
jgi:hypothetical protein